MFVLVFSLAAHVQWGWHLLAAVLVFGDWPGGCAGTSATVSLPAVLMITVAVQVPACSSSR